MVKGYDVEHPLLDQEENAQDDDYDDDAENIGLENYGSPIGTGEDEVYEEAKTSHDDVDVNAKKAKLCNSVVDNFYESIGYKPTLKFYDNFEYKDDKLYFIKDGQKIRLSNEKEKGNLFTLSTLKLHQGINFIGYDLGIEDYVTTSKEARAVLAEPVGNIAKTSAENVPMHNLPKVATNVERDVGEIVSIISQDEEEANVDGLPFRDLLGLDKALQTTRGELVNNLAK